MAFRSQRYHLSRDGTKKNIATARNGGEAGDGAKKRAAHTAVCTVVGAALVLGHMCSTLGFGR